MTEPVPRYRGMPEPITNVTWIDILSWREGDLPPARTLLIFAEMIRKGTIHQMDDDLQRQATLMIEHQVLSETGEVLVGVSEWDGSLGD